jgi:hypothetical protein
MTERGHENTPVSGGINANETDDATIFRLEAIQRNNIRDK